MVKSKEEERKTTPSEADNVNKDIEEMFGAGVHFGYSSSTCHPKMKSYLFGLRNNVEIFDLIKVNNCLDKARNFLTELGKDGRKFLIVATKPGINRSVEQIAKDLEVPYVTERWLGGTLTNFKVIKFRIDYFVNLRQEKAAGELNKYTKKEIGRFNKELTRLERFLVGLEAFKELPSALLIIDPKKEKTAMRESLQMSIPVIAVLNSDSDPTNISFPIPANDTSLNSVNFLMDKLAGAYKDGLKLFRANEIKPLPL